VPTSAVEVQQFLGLANYYQRFIKDFAAKAKPLHQLTEKRHFSNGQRRVRSHLTT